MSRSYLSLLPIREVCVCIMVLNLFIVPHLARAQSASEPLILSLSETIEQTLMHNLKIRVERFNPSIERMDVQIEKGFFDMEFAAGINGGADTRPTASTVEATVFGQSVTDVKVLAVDETTVQYDLGFSQELSTGGSYDLSFGVNRRSGVSTVFDPNFSSDLLLNVSQPLLKGFGPAVTRGDLRVAQNNYLQSQQDFEMTVADIVESVEITYWDLVFERKNMKVQKEALRAAEELHAQNRAKVELGILAPIEVLVAEAGVASRMEEVVVVEKNVRDAEDQLRQAMNLEGENLLEEQVVIPTSEPVTDEVRVDLRSAMERAFTHRNELKQIRLNLESQKILLHQARNGLLPSLDIEASTGLVGLAESYGDNFDELNSRDFYNWGVGVVFSMPMGNRVARSTYKKEQYELEKVVLELEEQEREVLFVLREVIREVKTSLKRIETTGKARSLAEKKVEAETERFRLGLTTTRNLLEFQKDLADAQNKELKAIVDYNKALVEMARVQGTLLLDRKIHLSDGKGESEVVRTRRFF